MTEKTNNCITQVKISNDILIKKKHGLDCASDKYCQFADSYQNDLLVYDTKNGIFIPTPPVYTKNLIRFTDHMCQTLEMFTPIKYGAFYNKYVVANEENVANGEWIVPAIQDFEDLKTFIGGAEYGYKLKEIGTEFWLNPNVGATNEFGFNGRGCGYRSYTGAFGNQKDFVFYWTSGYMEAYSLSYDGLYLGMSYGNSPPSAGYTIRLINTATTLTHGQTGVYTGNDGKKYPTVCIGTQEWLARDLAETKYANGNDIRIETDQVIWENLVYSAESAMCYYNNDINNA